MKKYQSFLDALKGLSELCGYYFVIKTSERAWLPPLAEEQRYHCCAYCKAVKENCEEMFLRCQRHHEEMALKEAVRRQEPFESVCHAGVCELVFPIISDRCRGAIFAGPFFSAEKGTDIPEDLQKIREQMQIFSQSSIPPLSNLLSSTLKLSEPQTWTRSPYEILPLIDYDKIDIRIQKALRYMYRNFGSPIQLSDAGKHVGLSKTRFSHCFSEEIGISFQEYLQRLRLSESIRWIEETDHPFSTIASMCGFTDQSRFSAQFKRYYKCTPKEFRNKLTAGKN